MTHSAFPSRGGYLSCEDLRIADLLAAGLPTPFFLYSAAELRRCAAAYAQAADGLAATIGYAVKANHNPAILALLLSKPTVSTDAQMGATVVSAAELALVLRAGCPGTRIVLHGNGKRPEDLRAAIAADALISLDSPFDLRHAAQAALALGRSANVLLRVNPDIDARVHPYITTGLHDGKFGMPPAQIDALLPELRALQDSTALRLRGLHCHLGSTLHDPQPFIDAAALSVALCQSLRARGFPIDTLDLGGGLGIDYGTGSPPPPISALLDPLRPLLHGSGLRLHLEPGRSLVGSAGALVARTIGIKEGPRRFLVIDASMAQLIRPCLYDAYHRVALVAPPADPAPRRCDVVGPICESADFLARDRDLPTPAEGDGVLIYDTGAYGFAMASRYNLNLLPAEYLVDGAILRCVRRAETLDDLLATSIDQPVPLPQRTTP